MELLLDPITINSRKVLAGFKLIGAEYSIKKIDFYSYFDQISVKQRLKLT